jgi:hypothetical protein
MKRTFTGRRLGAAALSAVALVGGGLALAPAASATASASASAPAAQVRPDANANGCVSTLTQWGYEATKTRIIICNVTAVAAFVSADHAFAACIPALIATVKSTEVENDDVLTTACFFAAYG